MDDLSAVRRLTYLDGPNIQRIEGRVSFIEGEQGRREVVVEATDGSAAFIPAHLLVQIDTPATPEPVRRAVEWPTARGIRGEFHTRQSRPWDETVQF